MTDKEMTREQAIAFAEAKGYELMSHRKRAEFQMTQKFLCMPFGAFHEAVEKTLERPVFTHEFGLNKEGLQKELLGENPAPTFDEILALIPEEKRIVVIAAEVI